MTMDETRPRPVQRRDSDLTAKRRVSQRIRTRINRDSNCFVDACEQYLSCTTDHWSTGHRVVAAVCPVDPSVFDIEIQIDGLWQTRE